MSMTRHFRRTTLNALAKRGILVIQPVSVPAGAEDKAFSSVAYLVDDNGTSRVWTFAQVLAASHAVPGID